MLLVCCLSARAAFSLPTLPSPVVVVTGHVPQQPVATRRTALISMARRPASDDDDDDDVDEGNEDFDFGEGGIDVAQLLAALGAAGDATDLSALISLQSDSDSSVSASPVPEQPLLLDDAAQALAHAAAMAGDGCHDEVVCDRSGMVYGSGYG